MALHSSGDWLKAEILLAATLRYLAGASYIDIVDIYNLPKRGALTIIIIDGHRSCITTFRERMRDLAYDWDMKMINNFPDHQGTTLV